MIGITICIVLVIIVDRVFAKAHAAKPTTIIQDVLVSAADRPPRLALALALSRCALRYAAHLQETYFLWPIVSLLQLTPVSGPPTVRGPNSALCAALCCVYAPLVVDLVHPLILAHADPQLTPLPPHSRRASNSQEMK